MGRVDEDPLTLALSPPPNETPEQREKRLREEARAQKISDAIDEEIKAQNQQTVHSVSSRAAYN